MSPKCACQASSAPREAALGVSAAASQGRLIRRVIYGVYCARRLGWDFELEQGSIPVEATVETGTAWRAPTRRGACFILPAISRVILLAFLLVSAAIDEENYFIFRWLWQWASIGQGTILPPIKIKLRTLSGRRSRIDPTRRRSPR